MANMLATFAQFERRLISQRTKEALAIKKASGVRLGRSPTLPGKVVGRIHRARARGGAPRGGGGAGGPRGAAPGQPQSRRRTDRTGRRAMVRGHRSKRLAANLL